jgi:uncharacterized protein (DUF2147 family)
MSQRKNNSILHWTTCIILATIMIVSGCATTDPITTQRYNCDSNTMIVPTSIGAYSEFHGQIGDGLTGKTYTITYPWIPPFLPGLHLGLKYNVKTRGCIDGRPIIIEVTEFCERGSCYGDK